MHLPANLKLLYGGAWHEPHGGYAPTMDPAKNISLADAPLADASDVDRPSLTGDPRRPKLVARPCEKPPAFSVGIFLPWPCSTRRTTATP
jgi:hypothetical protein